jgi:predicted dehydrogenase
MSKTLKIGMIGLDTSHAIAFTKLINDAINEYHVPGGKVEVAFPGGSPDFELSSSRVEGYTNQLRDEFGVQIVDSPEAVAESCDAILLESVDGRVHLEQFRKIAPFGKPVFVDKPFAVNGEAAKEIAALAKQYNIPMMSASALRYAEGLSEAIRQSEKGEIIGAETYGPMAIVPTQPGFFWYGIHSVEMLFTILGGNCKQATTTTTENHDVIVGLWEDGRIGTVRGNRKGNHTFGALIHREKGSDFVDVYVNPKPYYASMLEKIMVMFQTGKPDISIGDTLQIVRFIEAANESRNTGKSVAL